MVWDERIVTTGKNGDVTPFYYKEHIKHKKCLNDFEKLQHKLSKRKRKDDNDTSLMVSS